MSPQQNLIAKNERKYCGHEEEEPSAFALPKILSDRSIRHYIKRWFDYLHDDAIRM